MFLDCFALSDAFNTAKHFCLFSKNLLRIIIKVLKHLKPFPKAWAFLAFVPTSLKFLQAKIYKLCPLPDIAQQGGCWKNKKDRVVWDARSEKIVPACTSPCYQIGHLTDLSMLIYNKHVDSHLLEPTGWGPEEGVLGESWFLYGQETLNCKVSPGILTCIDTHLACRVKHSNDDQNPMCLSAPVPKGVISFSRLGSNHSDSEAGVLQPIFLSFVKRNKATNAGKKDSSAICLLNMTGQLSLPDT